MVVDDVFALTLGLLGILGLILAENKLVDGVAELRW
jgi:hypothetical protein